MLLLHKIILLLQIKIFLISVNCLKKPDSNLVTEEQNDNNNKDLMEKLLGPNYKSALQYDVKNNNPQVQIFTDDKSYNNNNNQHDITKYKNFLEHINYGQHNYDPQQYQHQFDLNNYPNKISQGITEQKEITDILKTRNNQKRDNHNQIKKPCNGKKNKDDDQPTPTYFYPKHIKGELVVHNPAPIIVKRPPTKVVVNHPAIIVRPQPVLINRAPQAINPVMVYKPPPAPPAEPLKIRPVFVKFESAGGLQHDSYHPSPQHSGYLPSSQHGGYSPHRMRDDDDDEDEKDGLFGEGTNVNFKGSPYYNIDGNQAINNYNQHQIYSGHNSYNREYNM